MTDRHNITKAGVNHEWFHQRSNRIDVFTKGVHGGTQIDENTSTDYKSYMLVCVWSDYRDNGERWLERADLFKNGLFVAGSSDPVVATNWLKDF